MGKVEIELHNVATGPAVSPETTADGGFFAYLGRPFRAEKNVGDSSQGVALGCHRLPPMWRKKQGRVDKPSRTKLVQSKRPDFLSFEYESHFRSVKEREFWGAVMYASR